MTIELWNWLIQYDRDYGCDHRTGWSIARDGSYLVDLEPNLLRALWQAIKRR